MNHRRKKADKYFAAHGINPNTPNSDGISNVLDLTPKKSWHQDSDGVISYP